MAAKAMTKVNSTPECNIDYSAKLRPKYMKNLNIHQYINTKVILRKDGNLNKSKKLYYFERFLG